MNRNLASGGGQLYFNGKPKLSVFSAGILAMCLRTPTRRDDVLLFVRPQGDCVNEQDVIRQFVSLYHVKDVHGNAFDTLDRLLRYVNARMVPVPLAVINAAAEWCPEDGFAGLLEIILVDPDSNLKSFVYGEATQYAGRNDENGGWGIYQSRNNRSVQNSLSAELMGKRIEAAMLDSEDQLEKALSIALGETLSVLRNEVLRARMAVKLLSSDARALLSNYPWDRPLLKVAS